MVVISDHFKSFAKGIYATSIICLALKLLDISSLTSTGLSISLDAETKPEVIGAISIVTAFLSFGAALSLVRDYIATSLSDDISLEELSRDPKIDFSAIRTPTENRRRLSLAFFDGLSWAMFAVVGLTPIILRIVTCTICWDDVLTFIQKVGAISG